MAAILQRYALSRLVRARLFWFFLTCVLFSGWVVLAVLTDELGHPLNHVIIYFCLAAAVILIQNFLQFRASRNASLFCESCRSVAPGLHKELMDLMRMMRLFAPTSFFIRPTNDFNAGVIYTLIPFRNTFIISFGAIFCLTIRELRAIFAHEFAHVKNRDMIAHLSLQAISAVLAFYGALWTFRYVTSFFSAGIILGLVCSFLSAILVWCAARLLVFFPFLRSAEYAADEAGAHIQGTPDDLIRLLQFFEQSFEQFSKTPYFLRDHPPIGKRIEALEKFKKMNRLG